MSQSKITSANILSIPTGEQSLLHAWMDTIGKDNKQPFALVKILGAQNKARQQLMEAIDLELTEFGEKLRMKPGNIPRMFEKFVEGMRGRILEAVLNGSGIPLSDFHAVFGIVYDNQILVAGCGKLTAVFMHQTAQKRYTIYQLNDHFDERVAGNPIGWNDILQSVLDGELNTGDIFYLGTRVPVNALNMNDLQDILVKLPIPGALKRIQQHVGAQTSYGAIGFKVKELSSGGIKKQNPLASMERFGDTQKETAQVLGDQVPDVQAAMKSISGRLSKQLGSAGKDDLISQIKKVTLSGIFGVQAILLNILPKKNLSKQQQASESKIDKLKVASHTARTSFTKRVVQLYYSLTNLSKWQAASIAVAFMGIALLIGATTLNSRRSKNQAVVQSAEIILDRIDEKVTAAEATLIYDNNEQAQSLLNEALALFGTLPEVKKLQDRESDLRERIDETKLNLRKVVSVEPTQVIELTNSPVALSMDGDRLAVMTDGGITWVAGDTNERLGDFSSTAFDAAILDGDYVFLTSSELERMNLDGSLSNVVSGVPGQQPLNAIEAYNSTLYTLKPDAQQVVRMRPQGDQYEAGTNWIIDRTSDLTTAKDIAIDGSIYILTNTGIAVYTSGREQDFELQTIEPTLTSSTEIHTVADLNALFLLDAANQRIIQLDKEGQLVAQYESDLIGEATTFTTNNSGTIIYFTTSTGLYEIVL